MEREQFAALIEKYRGQMLSLARARLNDGTLAEDAVQDACEKVWRAAPRLRFDSEEKARRYLVIAVTTAAIDLLRRTGTSAPVSFSDILEDPGKYGLAEQSAGASAEDRYRAGRVLALMEELGPKTYEALSLRAEGYSGGEIAKIMGISAGSANMLVHRGRKRLAAMLEKEEEIG